MSSTAKLLEAYASWRQFTESESASLRASDWEAVAKCQEAKALLQPVILELSEKAQAELDSPDLQVKEAARQIRIALAELLALEEANRQFLGARIEDLASQKGELNRTQQLMTRVHRSYSQPAPPNWHSYS